MKRLRLHRVARTWTLLLGSVAVGCSSATDPPSEITLTDSEIAAIATVIARQPLLPSAGATSGDRRVAGFRGMNLLPALVLVAVQVAPGPFTLSETVNCPGGGTAAISGSGNRAPDSQQRQTAVTLSPTVTFSGCRPVSGGEVVISGGSLSGSGNVTWRWPSQQGGSPTLLSFQLSRSGTLTVGKGSGSRSCAATLNTSGQGDAFETTGTICEQPVRSTEKPLGLRN